MRTRYILETLEEFKEAAERQAGEPLPVLIGDLEVHKMCAEPLAHCVKLVGDPNYELEMPFKEFVVQLSEMAGVKLMASANIPL